MSGGAAPPVHAGLLPPEVPGDRLAACIGLISDTHLPERLARLPAALFEALAGVDLVLHAGDLGELRVLDALSAIAPVVAVHGNDDTAEAQRALPYSQVVACGGQRLLLCHSHYPDRTQDLVARRDDSWGPKLDRRAELGRQAGATIVVYGHTHIPLTVRHAGVLLINPGAIASPNSRTRQVRQTVALLAIRDDGAAFAIHVDLASPERAYEPRVDLGAGFRAASAQFAASILEPELERIWPRLEASLSPAAQLALRACLRRCAHRCWAGQRGIVAADDLLIDLATAAAGSSEVRAEVEALLRMGSH